MIWDILKKSLRLGLMHVLVAEKVWKAINFNVTVTVSTLVVSVPQVSLTILVHDN